MRRIFTLLVALLLIVGLAAGAAAMAPPGLGELSVAPAATQYDYNGVIQIDPGVPGFAFTSGGDLTGHINLNRILIGAASDAGPPYSAARALNDIGNLIAGEHPVVSSRMEVRRFGAETSTGEPSGSHDRLLARHAPVPGWDMKYLA